MDIYNHILHKTWGGQLLHRLTWHRCPDLASNWPCNDLKVTYLGLV